VAHQYQFFLNEFFMVSKQSTELWKAEEHPDITTLLDF
jgi:hypothetical protein